MTNWRVCTQREPKADGLSWLLGWKWIWWLEDDFQGSWEQTWKDPWARFGHGSHRSRSKEAAIESGQRAIQDIRDEEARVQYKAALRAETHVCIPEQSD